jgi:hypothetical protein
VRASRSTLDLKDIVHLPKVEPLFERIVAGDPGMVLVAGMDPRPHALPSGGEALLPSGRAAIFRILMHQMLLRHPAWQATIVAETRDFARPRRSLRPQITLSPVETPDRYGDEILRAAESQPDLLVVGRLTAESAPAALGAAQSGLRILSQFDTIFRGAQVARHLAELGVSQNWASPMSCFTPSPGSSLCSAWRLFAQTARSLPLQTRPNGLSLPAVSPAWPMS